MSIEEFFQGVSALRNPELMRILKDWELVEGLGFGIRWITKIYYQDIFEFSENSLYITLPFDKEIENSREKSKGKILELIIANSQISVSEIADIIDLSVAGVEKNIRQLKKEGKLSRTTNTKSGEWMVTDEKTP